MLNYLSLDYGSKKIGVAYKIGRDPVVPTDSLQVNSEKQVMAEIISLAEQLKIDQIILGLPLNLRGQTGQQAKATIGFKQKLERRLRIPIVFSDERFSSKLFSAKKNIDSYSAADILERYLSYQKNKSL